MSRATREVVCFINKNNSIVGFAGALYPHYTVTTASRNKQPFAWQTFIRKKLAGLYAADGEGLMAKCRAEKDEVRIQSR